MGLFWEKIHIQLIQELDIRVFLEETSTKQESLGCRRVGYWDFPKIPK